MRSESERITVRTQGTASKKAAEILETELRRRTVGRNPACTASFLLVSDAGFANDDLFEIAADDTGLIFRANGTRGLIYAIGMFFRKAAFRDGSLRLSTDLSGRYAPKKPIRGHQLGYRPCNNTYDKWDTEDFRQYMLELMYFGMNTVELIPFSEQNDLMKYDSVSMSAILSEEAHALGLDVSLWIPNTDEDKESARREREALFRKLPYIDAVFIPGSDPGSLPAAEMLSRCRDLYEILIKYHPNAKIWPSAQAPHNAPSWGEEFLAALPLAGDGVGGVITGPNRAFHIDVLRQRLPEKYPIRFYPDITHNLRCEHPVHFEKDDWHYAFAAALSRECINPRPVEYKRLFDTIKPYTIGSVTYSDGVNDDVNKAVWCALEWDDTLSAEEIIEDYARAYLWNYDTDRITAAILLLEKNWQDSPLEKRLDFTLYLLDGLCKEENDWRFWQLRFRATCDKYVKDRLLADSAAVGMAKALIEAGDISGASAVLSAPQSEELQQLRREIDLTAEALYETVGMQLSVQKYHASGWERGATLDTIDQPLTDKEWLLYKIRTAASENEIRRAAKRNDVSAGDFYFSVALDGLAALWTAQAPDFYMNIQGDRPDVNNGALPVCLQKAYDHFSLRAELSGFIPGEAYELTVTYLQPTELFLNRHTVRVNGTALAPPAFNKAFTDEMLPPRFSAYTYQIPAPAMRDEKLRLVIEEPDRGFQLAEFRIIRRRETR